MIGAYPGVPEAAVPNIRSELVPVVKMGLRDSDPYVRREAANAASGFGVAADLLIPDLVEAVSAYPNEDTGWFSAEALGNLGSAARVALPALRTAVNQTSHGREWVAEAIRKIESSVRDGRPIEPTR
jgi:HEAT repeat protein